MDRVVARLFAERARQEAVRLNREGRYEDARKALEGVRERVARLRRASDPQLNALVARARRGAGPLRRADAGDGPQGAPLPGEPRVPDADAGRQVDAAPDLAARDGQLRRRPVVAETSHATLHLDGRPGAPRWRHVIDCRPTAERAAGWPPAEPVAGPASRRTTSMTAPPLGIPRHPDRPAAARHLLRRAAAPGPDGEVCGVDPASAGWDWTTFHVYRLEPGERVTGAPRTTMERLRPACSRATRPVDGRGPGLRRPGLARRPCSTARRRPSCWWSPGSPSRSAPRPDAWWRSRAAPGGPRPAHRPHRRRRHPRRGPRRGQHRPPDPPPAAAVGRGRPPDRVRGRSRRGATGPATRRTSTTPRTRRARRGSRSSTTTGSRSRTRDSPSRGSTRRTAAWTRRMTPDATATSCWCPRATTRSASRPATTATTSTSWPGRTARGTSRSTRTTPGS